MPNNVTSLKNTNGKVNISLSLYDFSRLVTSIRRYSEVLDSAKRYYQKTSGKDPNTMGNRSSCTTIFHLLDIPMPEDGAEIDLTAYPPIPPPCYIPKRTRKKKEVPPKSILKNGPSERKSVSFSNPV